MDVEQLEREAMNTATKHVINMLPRPGQLEKVEQYKRRVSRKKASVEAMLKSTLQSQLDGVCTGLGQLRASRQDVSEVKEHLVAIDQQLKAVPELVNKLAVVREKNMLHSQLYTAVENLKVLFTVPESVEKTRNWINEGKLLYAHHSLNDLENSRDDLLYELHKVPNQSKPDQVLLHGWFEDVDKASQLLEKQLRLVLSRTLNTVRKEPAIIVTALRIIEKEEKKDLFALQRAKQSGFMPPGRPKHWKRMVTEELEKSVSERIEGTQVEERDSNKMWLVVYLELTRQLFLEDLRVVKSCCAPCFPPDYDIVNKFVRLYHSALAKHLEEIVSTGIEGNEYVSILAWVINTYPGVDLLQHPDLAIDPKSLGPLLTPTILNQLETKYLKTMEDNYTEWMQKTLETEQNDWSTGVPPEGDQNGYFHTAAPVIIFQMIDQNLQVTKTIGAELTDKALVLSMHQVTKYGRLYRDTINTFKRKHFEDRSRVPFFTHYMITIVNNCILFVELAHQMKQHYWRTELLNNTITTIFSSLVKTFQDLRNEAARWLLEEAFLDLDSHFLDLFTEKWLSSTIPIDTVCVTLEDYFHDYNHLRAKNFDYVINEAKLLATRRYVSAMLQRRITFRSLDERRKVATKIIAEVKQLTDFFTRIAPKLDSKSDCPFQVILSLAEVIKSEDSEILSLDLHDLVDKYPDIKEDQLNKLLSLRGDLSRSETRDLVAFTLQSKKSPRSQTPSVFQQIP